MSSPPSSSSRIQVVAADLEAALEASTVEHHRPIGPLTTYRVGGDARLFVEVMSSADLAAVASVTSSHDVPVVVLGRGSNLLVADRGIDALVLRLGEPFATITELGDGRVRLGGSASLPAAARQLTARGLAGFEWAVGVPGSVGGAVRMNAGGHGADMAASLVSARVVDLSTGAVVDLDAAALELGYRRSSIRPHQLVVSADLQLEPGDPEAGQALLGEIVRWRRENQPGGQNAGSVFTNPPGDAAGRLIEAAGLKGLRIGTAEVSTKHANFIQADPGGRAGDVLAVMIEIVRRVREHAGIVLHAETELVGFDPAEIEALTHPGATP